MNELSAFTLAMALLNSS